MTAGSDRRLQVVLLSPCGWGNLGDAAIQDSAIAGIRRHLGEAVRIVGLTQNPPDTRARHGIDAYRLAGNSREHYTVGPNEAPPPSAGESGPRPDRANRQQQKRSLRSLIKSVVVRMPAVHRAIRGAADAVRMLRSEVRHSRFVLRLMRDSDLLIVSGGGQLDELWGGPWGHPFTIYKCARIARYAGCKVAVLSVGAGALTHGSSRRLVRASLRAADYHSFRDPRTVRLLESYGVKRTLHLVPDLAFGHPTQRAPRTFPEPGAPLTIALSPIAYRHPDVWPDQDALFFHDYLDKLAALGTDLLARGHRVILLTSDRVDDKVARDLAERMVRRAATETAPTAKLILPASTDELFVLLRQTDVLVASRLHGVILAQIVATPTVALSYDWKVDEQMAIMGMTDYCLPIDGFQTDQALEVIANAGANARSISSTLAANTAAAYERIDKQYTEIFSSIGAGRGS